MNPWSAVRFSCSVAAATYGPLPRAVTAIAIAERTSTARDVARAPKRSAAQISAGKIMCGWRSGAAGSAEKLRAALPSTLAAQSAASSARTLSRTGLSPAPQFRSTGATTSAPSKSPSHHACHAAMVCSAGTTPPAHKLNTPTDAATSGLSSAAPSSATACDTRWMAPPVCCAYARIRAPSSASSVLPAAMPIAASQGAPVQRFATSAPSATAGHDPDPRHTRAARAMPVGGHTSVAKPPTGSSARPSFAVAT
jgi:hypothetical protein